MANTIRIKRRAAGGAAGTPASLLNAELAYNEQDNVLYYGYGVSGGNSAQIISIAGPGAFTTLNTAQEISAIKTFTAAPIVPTQLATDDSTKAASTAYVKSVIGDGALTIAAKSAGATNTDVTLELSGAYSANTATARTVKAVVGPALTNLATLMTTAGAGFIKRGATADTYTIDTTAYTTNLGTVTAVTATAPVASSGGTTPVISMAAATTSVSGYLTSTDWNTFNGKQAAGTYATGTGSASGTNTGDNAVNTLYSGLVTNATHTGDATGATALTLATVNSNIGTFNNVTINAKGLATAGSNVAYLTAEADTLATITARGASTAVASTFSGGIAMSNSKVTGLATPTADTDAANKAYVDAVITGLNVKEAVRLATTTPLTATYANGTAGLGATLTNSGTLAALTLDGIAAVVDNRVLVKDQTTSFTAASAAYVTTSITVNFTAHGLIAGQTITVSGSTATTNAPNGTFTIATVPNANSFTYVVTAEPTGTIAGTIIVLYYKSVQNGIYKVTNIGSASVAWILTRTTDFDQTPTGEIAGGDFVFVQEGASQADNGYVVTTNGAITVGTTTIDFVQFSGAGQVTAGTGLTKTGNTLAIDSTVVTTSATIDGGTF